MSEKIAVHCPTEELWNKVQEKAFSDGYKWAYAETVKHLDWAECKRYIILRDVKELAWNDSAKVGYTIIPAEEWLAQRTQKTKCLKCGGFDGCEHCLPELKVGDSVEVVTPTITRHYPKGYKGTIVSLDTNDNTCKLDNIDWFISINYLKLIESEVIMKEEKFDPNWRDKYNQPPYTVPLRVDDKVRVVSGVGDIGEVCEVLKIDYDKYSGNSRCTHLVLMPSMGEQWKDPRGLELIPTEQDIVVGSVWKNNEDGKVAVIDIKLDSMFQVNFKSNKGYTGAWELSKFRDDYKLIHRGDEVVEGKAKITNKLEIRLPIGLQKEEITNKTNKKEKKMKKAGKVIKVGMLVVDRECSNDGRVEAIYKNQGKVTYTDLADNSIHTVDIERLFIPVTMPKPKPVVKKKATKKKVVKSK